MNNYFEHFDTLPKELRDLINEYGPDAEQVWNTRAKDWRTPEENKNHVLFCLESKRKFIQNYIINEALGTQHW